jgi:hypothetical protein
MNLKINLQHFLFLGIAQVASEGMDDTRMDLTQLEESGTGRSVPTTPLQVSPQGMQCSLWPFWLKRFIAQKIQRGTQGYKMLSIVTSMKVTVH